MYERCKKKKRNGCRSMQSMLKNIAEKDYRK